ncbi:hypothetical protein B9T33_12350 [Acinetobacter sp. ANC 5054]|uniref:NADAR family protein n=1 Tax=Acinetobacter sp. ANC 5054 TaxID=1977877 RepID=UPI000A34B994|nr:NADAR family protein [Acinetobacter sp. ANC 5054]OTG79266.1 hypothetical protein B9T33_12350 [Acinetobacter sp. ANC 5054]
MSDSQYLTDLQEQVQQGQKFKYLCFWGHTQKQKDSVDKSCFSQWFPSPFVIDDVEYKTAEHFMMAQKAKLFADEEIFQKILEANHPNEAKALGRKIQNYQENVWLEHRFDVVVKGNIAKFTQHPELKAFLLNTQERILVEASPVDKIWGIGLATDDEKAEKPLQWKGLNLLGFALMVVRTQL